MFTAVAVSIIAGIFPLATIAAVANAGTLAAFIAVCTAMLVMRRREPDAPRKFTTPLPWVVGIAGILGCAYLFISLPVVTQIFFLIAQVLGLLYYAVYGGGSAARTRVAAEWLQAERRPRSRLQNILGGRSAIWSNGSTGMSIPPSRLYFARAFFPRATPTAQLLQTRRFSRSDSSCGRSAPG